MSTLVKPSDRALGNGQLRAAATTDIGHHRQHNEDTFLLRPDLRIFAVADGMGGHDSGDVASAIAASAMSDHFEGKPYPGADLREPGDEDLPRPALRLVSSIRRANSDVYAASLRAPTQRGMGSTVVALHLPEREGKAYIGHVGDSRCYRIRDGDIELLTRDHSLVNEARLIDPTLTDEELARLPTNIITRALGLEPTVKVDLRALEVHQGDVFLLCSDGLSGAVSDREMVEAIRLADDLDEGTELLVALANEAGGFDNITAVLIAVP